MSGTSSEEGDHREPSADSDSSDELVAEGYINAYQDEPLAMPEENDRRAQKTDEDGILTTTLVARRPNNRRTLRMRVETPDEGFPVSVSTSDAALLHYIVNARTQPCGQRERQSPISLIKVTKARKPTSQVSTSTGRRRTRDIATLRAIESGGEEQRQMSLELKYLGKQQLQDILSITIPTGHLLSAQLDLGLNNS
ncbi:hypothetical protein Bbelb_272580 [Branchiostoma belcheri]|nr:hypothetical protein Bbelb_272580 [Branchiostoma belcheri]